MVRSMFAAISGLKTHQSRMDVIGNNIANVNTWGYKAQSANFTDTLYQTMKNGKGGDLTGGTPTVGGSGGVNASQLGFGVDVGSITMNHTVGSRSLTGRANELMIDGPAYFIVGPFKTTVGDSAPNDDITSADGLKLSRVAILSQDDNGYLVDDAGNYIYGYALNDQGEPTGDLKPLQCKPQKGDRYASISFAQDGTVSGVTTEGTIEKIGMIAVANVSNPAGLEKAEGYYYEIGENAGIVTVMKTNKITGAILSGYLEMSNTNLAEEMANMIITQRGYQANTKMITVTDQMLEELVNMKR